MNKMTLSVAFLALLSACSSTKKLHIAEGGHSETGHPALHAIQDQKLRELMDRMDVLLQERFMTEQQIDVERAKFLQRIADTAQELGQTVDVIVSRMPALPLSTDEQATFMALAGKLRQQTRQLQDQAQHKQIDSIDDSLHQLNTTCTSCHALFRETGR